MKDELHQRLDRLADQPESVVLREIQDTARDASSEIDRLRGLLASHGIPSGSEYICRCGLRRERRSDGRVPF